MCSEALEMQHLQAALTLPRSLEKCKYSAGMATRNPTHDVGNCQADAVLFHIHHLDQQEACEQLQVLP